MDPNTIATGVAAAVPAYQVTKALIDGAREFVAKVCLPVAEELGRVGRDEVADWAIQRRARVAAKAAARLAAENVDQDTVRAHPRIVGNLLIQSAWSDNEELEDLWAGLFAASCTNGPTDDGNLTFVDILSRLTFLQIRIFTFSCKLATKVVLVPRLLQADTLRMRVPVFMELIGENDLQRLDRDLDYLRALHLITEGFLPNSEIVDITPTPLALQMYARCNGCRHDPLDFYGLRDALPQSHIRMTARITYPSDELDTYPSSPGRGAVRILPDH